MNKSEFVRSMPNATASAVVAAAKGKGMTLSIGQVYNIRSVAKKRAGGSLEKLAANVSTAAKKVVAASKGSPLRKPPRRFLPSAAAFNVAPVLADAKALSALDNSFLTLLRRIGTDRAKQLLEY